jgi:hypothetical protein
MTAPFDMATALSGRFGGVNRKSTTKMSQARNNLMFCCETSATPRNFRKNRPRDAQVFAAVPPSHRRDGGAMVARWWCDVK